MGLGSDARGGMLLRCHCVQWQALARRTPALLGVVVQGVEDAEQQHGREDASADANLDDVGGSRRGLR